MTSSGPDQPPRGPEQPWSSPPPARAAGPGFERDRIRTGDLLVAGGALLHLVVGFLPWASVTFDFVGRITASGYEFSSLVVLSALLLLAAGAWAVLPAVQDVRVGFPRSALTFGLAAVALLFTLIAWLRSLDYDFQLPALLGVLSAAAVTVLAALSLLPELRDAPGAGQSPPYRPAPGPGQPQCRQPPPYGQPGPDAPPSSPGWATAAHPTDPDRPRPAADR